MLGIGLLVHAQHLTGSFAAAGLVSGVYAIALGVGGPLLGRLVDRRGQTAVLLGCARCGRRAAGRRRAAARGAPPARWSRRRRGVGLSDPPVGACLRALLPGLVDDAAAAYAAEATASELTLVAGPPLVLRPAPCGRRASRSPAPVRCSSPAPSRSPPRGRRAPGGESRAGAVDRSPPPASAPSCSSSWRSASCSARSRSASPPQPRRPPARCWDLGRGVAGGGMVASPHRHRPPRGPAGRAGGRATWRWLPPAASSLSRWCCARRRDHRSHLRVGLRAWSSGSRRPAPSPRRSRGWAPRSAIGAALGAALAGSVADSAGPSAVFLLAGGAGAIAVAVGALRDRTLRTALA